MNRHIVWPLAVIIGAIDAVVLYVFELVGINLTHWLWDDLLGTNEYRWRVLPVAVVLGVILTALFKLLHVSRVVPAESDLLAEMDEAPATLPAIAVVLAIGAMSLLAGGSIGPEQSLMTFSAALGVYAASRLRLNPIKQLLILASIGALLVAFVGSMVLVLVPLLLLFQGAKKQGQRLQLKPVAVVLLAGLASFATIKFIDQFAAKPVSFAQVPDLPSFANHDFAVALVLGFIAGILSLCMTHLIRLFCYVNERLDNLRLPAKDWVAGIAISLVLGTLYLLGGESVEFTGKIGSELLVTHAAQYSALALAGMLVVKLLATAWSKGTGYRGGLVFPSIYIGLALGLLFGQLFSGLAGAGAMIGGISGILTAAVGSPVIAAIFLVAVLPLKFLPVAACAIVGTTAFNQLSKRLAAQGPKS